MWEYRYSPGLVTTSLTFFVGVCLGLGKLTKARQQQQQHTQHNHSNLTGALILAGLSILSTLLNLLVSKHNAFLVLLATNVFLYFPGRNKCSTITTSKLSLITLCASSLFQVLSIVYVYKIELALIPVTNDQLFCQILVDICYGGVIAVFLLIVQAYGGSLKSGFFTNSSYLTPYLLSQQEKHHHHQQAHQGNNTTTSTNSSPTFPATLLTLYSFLLMIVFAPFTFFESLSISWIPPASIPIPLFHPLSIRTIPYRLLSTGVSSLTAVSDSFSKVILCTLVLVLAVYYGSFFTFSCLTFTFYFAILITFLYSPSQYDSSVALTIIPSSLPIVHILLVIVLSAILYFDLPFRFSSAYYSNSSSSSSSPFSSFPTSFSKGGETSIPIFDASSSSTSLASPTSPSSTSSPVATTTNGHHSSSFSDHHHPNSGGAASSTSGSSWKSKIFPFTFFIVSVFGLYFAKNDQGSSPSSPLSGVHVDNRGNTKWIIVTTINEPSSTLEALCALPDWEVAVVADSKTPKDWSSGPACHFLSLQDQSRLPFAIVDFIPLKAYTRKNLGYMFAIANGAQVIFDTDDDNLPNKDIVLEDVDDLTRTSITYQPNPDENPVVNPYSHFARPDIWPRGYPLNYYDSRERLHYLYFPTNSTPLPQEKPNVPDSLGGRALVQQYLADLDPDVDALFRLLKPENIAQVRFCKSVPPIRLTRGIMAPFNSQNTLWHKDAFWGLVLPITVTFRVTDILRSYWVQRILWDVGGALEFGPPSVDQIRNAHNYLDDFDSEIQLYLDGPKLVNFLRNWVPEEQDTQSSSSSTSSSSSYARLLMGYYDSLISKTDIDEDQITTSESNDIDKNLLMSRIVSLMKSLENEGFVKHDDVLLAQAWLSDLDSVGYQWPQVMPWSKEEANDASTRIGADEFEDPNLPEYLESADSQWKVMDYCDPRRIRVKQHFDDVLLVVILNTELAYRSIPHYLDLYDRFFSNIVFYGPKEANIDGIRVRPAKIRKGELGFRALMDAVRNEYKNGNTTRWKGFLYTNDDLPINPYALATLDLDKLWLAEDFNWGSEKVVEYPLPGKKGISTDGHWWYVKEDGWWKGYTAAFNDLPQVYRERLLEHSDGEFTMYYGNNDFWYLPNRLAPEFIDLLDIYSKHQVWHEIVFQTIMRLLPPEEMEFNIPNRRSIWLWNDDRKKYTDWFNPRTFLFHPVKLRTQKLLLEWKKWLLDCKETWDKGSILVE